MDLTVRSDFPIIEASSFWVALGLSLMQRKTIVSSKVQFKVQNLPFGVSVIALWAGVAPGITSMERLRSSLVSPRITLRRKSSTNSVVGDTFRALYDALTSALRKYHECCLNISFDAGIPIERRYFIRNTAVVRVFPSRNGCICHRSAMNRAKCRITSVIGLFE